MKKKIYYTKIENFCGLEYLTLENAPTYKDSEYGEVIDLTAFEKSKLAAEQILYNMVPIRGKEVSILRLSLGLSLEKFAREFKLSSATVLKWERAKVSRLSLPNEIAVRLFCAEKLNHYIEKNYSYLVAAQIPLQTIKFKAA